MNYYRLGTLKKRTYLGFPKSKCKKGCSCDWLKTGEGSIPVISSKSIQKNLYALRLRVRMWTQDKDINND